MWDAFLSYAEEDEKIALQIEGELKAKGFKIWYAPLNLKPGNRLLDSIEEGLKGSYKSILLISKNYLSKGWTNYEMDIIIRDYIEKQKKIIPIWHNVSKVEVENRYSGLAGIYALRTNDEMKNIISTLTGVLGKNAPTIGVASDFDSPESRFLRGRGEIFLNSSEGPATTLWELLVQLDDSKYPIYIGGNIYSKRQLLLVAANLITKIPHEVVMWVNEDGYQEIWDMCVKAGYNPKFFE